MKSQEGRRLSLPLELLLHRHDLVVTHGAHDAHTVRLALGLEGSLDLSGEVIGVTRQGHILAQATVLRHEGGEAILGDVDEGVLDTGHVGDVSSVGRGDDVLVLLAGEDINGSEVTLGVSVLSSLGGRHGRDLQIAE
jgi:hypothetical protein